MKLVFLGPPGAGKGTMAELADQRLGVAHLSSGDLLRAAVKGDDPVGREIARIMQSGALVPDGLVTKLVLQRLERMGPEQSFVLDGFPRTVEQAKGLDEALAKFDRGEIDLAVDFEMSQPKVVSRLAGRRICGGCGANYHLETLRPKREGVCDRCGADLVVRADDRPETIVKRLNVYHQQTEPLLEFYRERGKLRPVSGELAIEDQYRALAGLLEREGLVGHQR